MLSNTCARTNCPLLPMIIHYCIRLSSGVCLETSLLMLMDAMAKHGWCCLSSKNSYEPVWVDNPENSTSITAVPAHWHNEELQATQHAHKWQLRFPPGTTTRLLDVPTVAVPQYMKCQYRHVSTMKVKRLRFDIAQTQNRHLPFLMASKCGSAPNTVLPGMVHKVLKPDSRRKWCNARIATLSL